MKKILSILVAKIIGGLSRLMGHKGSSLPGLWATRIDKDILKKLRNGIQKDIIVVCGTNGKTTTNNMIEQILRDEGHKVICNKVGANMYYGVVTAFVLNAPIFGRFKADYATIEVDEFSTPKVFKELKPNYFVLTNLFRDQLDRYGEIEITIDALRRALEELPEDATYILNGDDPLSAGFGYEASNRTVYYGAEKTGDKEEDDAKEGRFCQFCNQELKYNFYHYSQLGDYYCEGCGFKRPCLDYEARRISQKDGLSFDVSFKGELYPFDIPYKGFYNVYNILASVAVAEELDIGIEAAETVLEGYETQIGRMESFFIKKPIFLNLSKNPAGFNQGIETVLEEEESLDILLVLNDNAQDGEDVSWIWDSYFDHLDRAPVCHFYIAGGRGYDMALRLKYGGISADKMTVYDTIEEGVNAFLDGDGKKGYALVNYTALFEIQKYLKEKEKKWSIKE